MLSYLDPYGHLYPSQWSMVVAITNVLTGEAADSVADLHSDHARELCIYRGLPPRLTEWFKAAIDLDVGLREFRPEGRHNATTMSSGETTRW